MLLIDLLFMQEKKKTEAALSELRRNYETEICELQCKIQRMQMVNPAINHLSIRLSLLTLTSVSLR